jgi:predicted RNA-binding protein with PUA-like domain
MNYWLVKSEGECYSIDDLRRDKRTAWEGIRNFQARNFMKDAMKVGDLVLFYHSMSDPTGVYGVAKVASASHIDQSALDSADEHYDSRAVKYQREGREPLWVCVDLEFVKKFAQPISLQQIKQDPNLRGISVAKRGQRLSVMPINKKHFEIIEKMGK